MTWSRFFLTLVAQEISRLARFYDATIQISPQPSDDGTLLKLIDGPNKKSVNRIEDLPDLSCQFDQRTLVLLNGNLNFDYEIIDLFRKLHDQMSRSTRLVCVVYNGYLSIFFRWSYRLGIIRGREPDIFLTFADLDNIAKLTGFERVRSRPVCFFPFGLFGLGAWLNSVLTALPGLRWLGAVTVVVLKPIKMSQRAHKLSVIIPARNEEGNIESAMRRLPKLTPEMEVVFVEGHSKDGTWDAIQKEIQKHHGPLTIRAFRQTGIGKADAVDLGIQKATGDVVVILDADLTMPPEKLGQFWDAFQSGRADFVNGSRLLFPMEGQAMRFLNHLGNLVFVKSLSVVLDHTLTDTLCGTKLMAKHDWIRFRRWREQFGKYDPFGDFNLIFPAVELGLGMIDIPIRYMARTYGTTNISRFRHGFMLAKMTWIGFVKIRLGARS